MYGLLLTAAVAMCLLIVKKAQQPQTEVTDGVFEPLPGGGEAFKWHAGMPLPSLEQLKNQCTIIGEELGRQCVLCTTPLHAGCDKDEDFSTHYGQPVYVCKI